MINGAPAISIYIIALHNASSLFFWLKNVYTAIKVHTIHGILVIRALKLRIGMICWNWQEI